MIENWLFNQIDYLLFIYGIAFFMLAIFSFRLLLAHRDDAPAWGFLVAFGCMHGLKEWVDICRGVYSQCGCGNLLHVLLAGLSFLALFEFGRRSLQRQTGKSIPGWAGVALVLSGFAGGIFDFATAKTAFRYALIFPGALLAGWALLNEMRRVSPLMRPGYQLALLAILFYGLTAGQACSLVSISGQAVYGNGVNSPVAALAVKLLIFLLILAVPWYHLRSFSHSSQDIRQRLARFLVPVFLLLLLVTGWFAAEWRGRAVDSNFRQETMRLGISIAQALNADRIKALSFTAADEQNPVFTRVSEQMRAFGKHYPSLRGIYTVAKRDSVLVFGPENYDKTDPLSSPVGTVYENPHPALKGVFDDGVPIVVGPYSDEYGVFVSAFVPVLDPATGEILIVVGIDVLGSDWESLVKSARLTAIVVNMLLFLFAMFSLLLLIWRETCPMQYSLRLLTHTETFITLVFGVLISLVTAGLVHEAELDTKRTEFRWIADAKSHLLVSTFGQFRKDLEQVAGLLG
ncbi:MAG: hypothetical protein PHD82_16610, partial [Candidatus Riflebacteria bacterium]|nr:hypothetical protein [Candidatus Riflebacteria bacterium]